MLPRFLLSFSLLIVIHASAQVQVTRLLGEEGKMTNTGYGLLLKLVYPITQTTDLTLEGSYNRFEVKDDSEGELTLLPVKIGFRNSFNQKGTGIYIEGQFGMNVYESYLNASRFRGFVFASEVGYSLKPLGFFQPAIGFSYEWLFHGETPMQYLSLRLSSAFLLRKR